MASEQVTAWPRPYFKASEQPTKVFFVCFGKAPLANVQLDLARFGLPSQELADRVHVREYNRASARDWFEGWFNGPFGVIAAQDLEEDLPLLTTSNLCLTLSLELPDRADMAPLQSVWGLSRWLCARGANVVLDVHAFRFRSKADVDALSFVDRDVSRDVKLVLESEPTQAGLHLMHTRGLCKFARPELLCFIRPEDAAVVGRIVDQLARTLMEGALASQIRLRVADGVELTTSPASDHGLVASLGVEAAVQVGRSDGQALAGIARFASAT